MGSFQYVGSELELFADCKRWKGYFSSQLARHIGGDVVEVGAGVGANTSLLWNNRVSRWVCIEPDVLLAEEIKTRISDGFISTQPTVRVGTLTTALEPGELFDTAIYIDVIEHIEDDAAELATAASRLRTGGHLVVLAPAHNFLFSPFDASIGHYRRYNASMLRAVAPKDMKLVVMRYLDSVGLLASLANRMLLKQSMPTKQQLALWDRSMVPLSVYVDPVFGYSLGKSVIAVWQKG